MIRILVAFMLGAAIMAASFHVGSAAVDNDIVIKVSKPPVKEWTV